MKTLNLDTVKKQYNHLTDNGYYNKAAYLIADEIGLKMTILGSEFKKHFPSNKDERYVFKIKLSKGGKSYTLNFGQSFAKGGEEPTLYDVLTCLQKYDVGTFENFCDDFGFDNDSRTAERTYKAVLKEWKAMERLFTSEELELLQEIQ